jgi:hypothetical protein
MQTNVLAMVLAALMVGAVAGPAMAVAPATAGAGNTGLVVDVTQSDGVTVTVTDNGTGVGNASVEVATVDSNATYNDTGDYTTGPDGTVSLSAPTEHVEVSVTATSDSETATTTAILEASENATYENFGRSVSAFVAVLSPSEMDGPPGHVIAPFVLSNNPGEVPDHAGPPDDESDGNETDDESDDNETGPPDHAGPPDDESDDTGSGNSNNGNDRDDEGGGSDDRGDNGKSNGRN